MLLTILLPCLCAYFEFHAWWNEFFAGHGDCGFGASHSFIDYAFGVFVALFVLGIFALVGLGLSAILGAFLPKEKRQEWKGTLVALRDKDSVGGNFFLGSGRIEGAPYYFYYYKFEDGFKPSKCPADWHTTVREEDRKDGRIVHLQKDFKYQWMWWIAVAFHDYEYEITIPTGSIRQGFSI
jgi:hypothetical protein